MKLGNNRTALKDTTTPNVTVPHNK